MTYFPFGELKEDRVELSKRYGLFEMTNGFWRLTKKCKSNYELMSYVEYLQGKVERPSKKTRESAIVEMFSGL